MEAVRPFDAPSRSVAFVVSHSSAGGAQEIWANLAEGFFTRGFATRLVALYPYRETVRATSASLTWTHVVPARPTSPRAQANLLRALIRLFRDDPPDIVFTAMPAANVLVPLAARLAGARSRVVISHHSPVDTYNRVLNAADRWIGGLANVRAVISVSDAVGGSLDGRPRGYREKRRTIHNALPPAVEARLRALRATRPRDRARGRSVIATGRLAAQKNYPVLIRAAAHMPDVEIRIVGDGPDEAALKALVRETGVADRVRFLGHRPRVEVLDLLAQADVFVQPSLFEGHSLALVEAATLAMPLVVSDVPVQIEGITAPDGTRCGVAVGVQDDRALAGAITRLLDEPACYAEAVALSERLAETRTYAAMMTAYERVARA